VTGSAFGDGIDQAAARIGTLLDDVGRLAADRSVLIDRFGASFIGDETAFGHSRHALA